MEIKTQNEHYIFSQLPSLNLEYIGSMPIDEQLTNASQSAPSLYLSEPLPKALFDSYESDAHCGISQIEDPLWQKICLELLNILGPIAFGDLWKINLISVSSDGKKVYLSCPSEITANRVETYHFVIIDVLRKFYPALTLIESEILSKEREQSISI
ncbi:MAG: hypothetical protein K2Y08_00660 [Alphaproteobacteria bacterium]|nr:hypothetical protein [Alphaproteobacteria bacterium]